mgnify:CR=1 FL=1
MKTCIKEQKKLVWAFKKTLIDFATGSSQPVDVFAKKFIENEGSAKRSVEIFS